MKKTQIARIAFVAALLSIALVGASMAISEAVIEDQGDWECPVNVCSGPDGFPTGTCELAPGITCDVYRTPGSVFCYSDCVETEPANPFPC